MFKLGQAAGLLALQSKYCNPDAVPLQKQHNDKCTLKKLMEYSIDTFSKKDNDSGETADAGRWAVAAGSAACTMPGGAPPDMELVEKLR